MYSIALCGDEALELDRITRMLERYESGRPGTGIAAERFEGAQELLGRVREREYEPDLIIMDIYMSDKLGIEAARELRSMGSRGRIIFVTSSREHALEDCGVDAVQYLLKPVSEGALFSILDKIFLEPEERRKYVLLRIGGSIRRVAADDIICCEAQGKQQCLHFADGSQSMLRTTMNELYEMLSRYPAFVRVGIAYIVNLKYVDSLNARELKLDNGRKIFLPRGSYRALRDRYFGYYCEEP